MPVSSPIVPGSRASGRGWRLCRHRAAAVAIAVTVMSALSACSDHIGAAASVGGVTIPESSVAETTAKLVAAQGAEQRSNGDLQLFNRTALTTQIRHQLVSTVAAAQGVTVSDADFTAAMASGADSLAQQLGVPVDQVPQTVRDTLAVLALARKTAGRPVTDVSVKVDILSTFNSRDEAVAAREKYLADPAAMDAAVQVATAGQQGGSQSASLLKNPQLGAFGVYHEPSGSIAVIESAGKFVLARIQNRTVTQSNQLVPSMQAAAGQQDGQRVTFALAWLAVQQFVPAGDVTVNPRFGVWDPISLQVVPSNGGL